ncbi:TATA-binding protein-associated factor mot1 [Cladophialophora chaetospira]|uniref:TATA-binding protein-associated factor mot1 n=1 Tax=Cladophialophora chaetospira TaxID=386627 RepID=A0AA38X629_9EURO|nr:TATA-binding protein-associated factor mot1 [Cladophialophora chaetospira]
MATGTSRLDRLVTLLDKGSTQLIRNTAAQQLADVQKQNPDNLFALLGRVLPYLQSKSWDTRTAAAKAIGGIVEHADKFDPNADETDTKFETPFKVEDKTSEGDDFLQLGTLDIKLILTHGKKLLGSAGKEYEYSMAGMTPAQRLAHQKQNLTARLGLGGEYIEDDLVNEQDFAANSQHKATTPGLPKVDTKAALKRQDGLHSPAPYSAVSPSENSSQPLLDESGLSKRQLNQLKRKNKTAAKTGSSKMRVVDLSGRRPSEPNQTPVSATPHPVKLNGHDESNGDVKPDYFSIKQEGSDDNTALVSEFKGEEVPEKPLIQPDEEHAHDWPFDVMCDFLSNDLFDPNWEVRHGAAMGLREVLRVHGRGAGRRYGKSRCENDFANRRWLDDMACRFLSVLMLDRFGDYVSDTVVAPIRESIGQTLGALLSQLPDDIAISVYNYLQEMVNQQNTGLKQQIWEVCHGGMIGLRYFVAIRKDLLLSQNSLLDGVVSAVIRGLAHPDDDVKSVSAATLVPIAQELTTMRPNALGQLISVVWDCLLDMQDDLSASTGAVMDLLAILCSHREILEAMRVNAADDPDQTFEKLIPRLYPFLRHTITSVRMAVLKALLTFLNLSDVSSGTWVGGLITRLIFQNMLFERNEGVLWKSFEVWQALVSSMERHASSMFGPGLEPHLSPMVLAAIQPVGQIRSPIPMDTNLLIKSNGTPMAALAAKHRHSPDSDQQPKKRRKLEKPEPKERLTHNTDGHMIHGEVDLVGFEVMLRTRIVCSRALGLLLSKQSGTTRDTYWSQLIPVIGSAHSSSRLFAGMLLEELAKTQTMKPANTPAIVSQLQQALDEDGNNWYADIVSSLQAARGQCQSLISAFQNQAHVSRDKLPAIAVVCQGESGAGPKAFSLADAERIVTTDFERLLKGLTPAQRVSGTQYLNEARTNAKTAVDEAARFKAARDVALKATVASVLVRLNEIPKKPGQLIKCIMDSIKSEEFEELQARSASAVAGLIDFYTNSPKRGPIDKLVSNLVKFTCVDTSETPEFGPHATLDDVVLSLRKEEDRKDHPDAARFEQEAKEARIMRRGAKRALDEMAQAYGAGLFDKLPVLRSLIENPIREYIEASDPATLQVDDEQGQSLVDALSALRTLTPTLHPSLHAWVLSLSSATGKAMRSRISVIRYSAAKCFATMCSVIVIEGMTKLVEDILPNISNPLDLRDRQGITECVYHLIQAMGDRILPYVIFLIVPVLGRMSDANNDIRLLATTSFATLVKLVPLEAGIPDPPGMPDSLLQGRERERKFMAQMLDPKKVESFQIPVTIKAELRSYQQDGVNWLAFLNKYNLHGVLCDDMGLGKTLQTLCIVASDHHIRAEEYAKTQAPDMRRLPSLIVCPPTLSGHWQQEIKQFAPFLSCVAYVGPPAERNNRRPLMATADVVITSYDVCRNDNDILTAMTWNYCILDEGHLIKNPKAKITQATKKIVSNHRLILSGTPIQNNVLELWSLFDFLMPGFLGTEKVFQDRFAKPIAASRNAKSSSKEQEAGALAIEALHKQVLPFLLRRLKEEVLDDLPPKILQNYYCDLSDLQKRLFEDFFKKERKTVENNVGSADKEAKQHIFQALQYMRKLCNSPALVVKEGNKQYEAIQKQLAVTKSSLRDVAHAPKLGALRDLLIDCGIGVSNEANDLSASNYVSQHRALIFCQMKEMLDMVQTEVLGKLLPSVQFLRLDGSVEATKRQNIVNQFNNDPSYDCLLLTTSVGGLGLNLTGADTVIFVEHDWNPQKDIQAMDRAHRIGQKKVVNVYRLITRGTLEEKILSLQRFKIDVASTVVNQQNAGLGSMETDQILDLFNLGETSETVGEHGGTRDEDMVDIETGEVKKKGEKGWLDDVGELWDERQYEEEFNLDSFVQNLQK